MTQNLLMNPKSGGTSLAHFGTCVNACTKRNVYTVHFHPRLNVPNSTVTLRDPCERTWSAFLHLRDAYSNHGECTPPLPARCASHWIHNMSYGAFVGRLVPLQSRWRPSITRGFERHMVLVYPQAAWVANATRVICTPALTAALEAMQPSHCDCARAVGTAEQRNSTGGGFEEGLRLDAHQPARECARVRAAYPDDTRLFERHCGGGVF